MRKLFAMVVDNAANMSCGVSKTGFYLIHCTAHTIQLAIHDVLDNNSQLQVLLTKWKALVGHFKRSNIDKAKLDEMQKKLEVDVNKLIRT